MAIWGMPASLYTREAGMVVPELKCPSMPLTLASAICCATCTPVRGSAWSSLDTRTNLALSPSSLMPLALASSSARVKPLRMSSP